MRPATPNTTRAAVSSWVFKETPQSRLPAILPPHAQLVKASVEHVILSRQMETDIQFMQEALAEARSAAAAGEVPIGALLVHNCNILPRPRNRTICNSAPTAHPE